SKGSSTGTGLRSMPLKICEVTPLSCTSAGIDLGSKPLTWRRMAKAKLEATAGAVSSSERSWSITARHSTRTAEIEGVWNVCAATGAAPAGASEVATSSRMTSPTAFPATASPLGANQSPRARLILCALHVRPVFRHHHDTCPHGNMRRYGGADPVRKHGGLIGRRGGLALGDGLRVHDFQGGALRQRHGDRVHVVERQLHDHVLLQIGGRVADDILRHLDLVVGLGIHEVEAVAIFVEIIEIALFHRGLFDRVGGLVALGDLYPVADSTHFNLTDGRSLAGMDVLGADNNVKLAVLLDDVALANRTGDDSQSCFSRCYDPAPGRRGVPGGHQSGFGAQHTDFGCLRQLFTGFGGGRLMVADDALSPWWSAERHADVRPFLNARGTVTRAVRAWFAEQ